MLRKMVDPTALARNRKLEAEVSKEVWAGGKEKDYNRYHVRVQAREEQNATMGTDTP